MLINFENISEVSIPNLNGGEGVVTAKMFMDGGNKIMISTLPAGATIGKHLHENSCEINYVLQGKGKAICDGVEEILKKGNCHCCPVGSSHSIINDGDEDLVLFTVVS